MLSHCYGSQWETSPVCIYKHLPRDKTKNDYDERLNGVYIIDYFIFLHSAYSGLFNGFFFFEKDPVKAHEKVI